MTFKNRIANLHYRPGESLSPWLWPLLPLAWVYGAAVKLRLMAYRHGWLQKHLANVPVISVGNLTTGGTGKTPIVIAIAQGLIKAGKTVVILSRGYGAPEPVAYARALDPRHGDEAYLMQEQVPEAVVVVGRDRVQTLQRAVQDYKPDYVLLDDGYQYLRLARDINILLVDGERLTGNGHLLPAGPLREPLAEIRRADLVFLTKSVDTDTLAQVEQWLKRYGPGTQQVQVVPVPFQAGGLKQADQKETRAFAEFKNRPAVAFSGVANPARFERDLAAAGLHVLRHVAFGDHHVYTDIDLRPILTLFEQHAGQNPVLVTTEKDLPKVRSLVPPAVQPHLYTLQVTPALDGQWFYHEFLTQMPGHVRAEGGHVQPSGR